VNHIASMFRFETARLVVRPHRIENAEKYHQWENDPDLVFMNIDDSDRHQPVSLAQVRQYLGRLSRTPRYQDSLYYAIYKKDDDSFIGFGMIGNIEPDHRRCKLGITIGEKAEWGKGYAREALEPVIAYCFAELGMNRIVVEIYCFNERSIRLFKSLGFAHEATLRQSVWKRGQPVDDCLLALLRQDWEGR
jgi:diamine N-acetyltransferase